MDSHCNLFRVIAESDLALAVASGLVPRCASDERSGCIHLNLQQDVEAVANAYFSADERPVVLELRRLDIDGHLVVQPPGADKPWQQVELHQPNILMKSVVAVHRLEMIRSGVRPLFRMVAQRSASCL